MAKEIEIHPCLCRASFDRAQQPGIEFTRGLQIQNIDRQMKGMGHIQVLHVYAAQTRVGFCR